MRNQLPCVVADVSHSGPAVRVELALSDGTRLASRITRRARNCWTSRKARRSSPCARRRQSRFVMRAPPPTRPTCCAVRSFAPPRMPGRPR
ncbi:TOBE domain-containing protein [Thauera humireducens]|uniref:TOBE domain-containing protein n=1 Tax=Thauera humireducens TaxID=1134435 RepID=UPI00311F6EEE